MSNMCKTIAGFIIVIWCLAGNLCAYSQETSDNMLAPLVAVPLETESDSERLNQLSMDVEYLRSQLEKKADKPSTSKGWSAPKVGGRFFIDYVTAANQDWDGVDIGNNVATQNWFGYREARITMTGTGYDFLDYKLELGFEKNNNIASYKDVFLGIQHVPILEYVRIGNQYVEDAGSEICNGTTNYTFMEAPAPVGQYFMSRRLGITSHHLFVDDRIRMFFGIYDATNVSDIHYAKDDNQGYALNTRMTMAPVFCQDGRRLLLVGAYYNFVDSSSANNGNSKRALAFNRPGGWDVYNPTGVGDFFSHQYQKAGFEAVCQAGRFCVQADLFLQHYADVNNNGVDHEGKPVAYANIGNQTNYGGFIMARWFLTQGDYRKYNLKSACWDGVEISRPFKFGDEYGVNWPSGCGAWEVAGMYGIHDTFVFSTRFLPRDNDRMTNQQVGVALNWYWNSNVKWAVNYFHDMSKVRQTTNDYYPTGDFLGMSCRVAF